MRVIDLITELQRFDPLFDVVIEAQVKETSIYNSKPLPVKVKMDVNKVKQVGCQVWVSCEKL